MLAQHEELKTAKDRRGDSCFRQIHHIVPHTPESKPGAVSATKLLYVVWSCGDDPGNISLRSFNKEADVS